MSFRQLVIPEEDSFPEGDFVPTHYLFPDGGGDLDKLEEEAIARATQIKQLLQRGQVGQALKLALERPVYSLASSSGGSLGGEEEEVEGVKKLNTRAIYQILQQLTKANEIQTCLAEHVVEKEAQLLLLKYLYKAMLPPPVGMEQSGIVLLWHEKLVELAGVGCIVRVMTDRRIV